MEPVYTTNVTRCPNGDSGIFFTWDVRNGAMRAGVSASLENRQQALRAAYDWCGSFNLREKRFPTLHEANRFVERYDTWFHTS